jgi:hypothetical protein
MANQNDTAAIRKAYQPGLTRGLQFMAGPLVHGLEDAEDSIGVYVKREMQTWSPELMAQQMEMFKAAKAGKQEPAGVTFRQCTLVTCHF